MIFPYIDIRPLVNSRWDVFVIEIICVSHTPSKAGLTRTRFRLGVEIQFLKLWFLAVVKMGGTIVGSARDCGIFLDGV